jgi:hypothetical protein
MINDRNPCTSGRVPATGSRTTPDGQQLQTDWLAAWLAPLPNWLERLDRGAPLPRLLRR